MPNMQRRHCQTSNNLQSEHDPLVIEMSRTHPPVVPAVFDPEYRAALDAVMARFTPSEMVGAHRWKGTDADRAAGAFFAGRRLGAIPEVGRVVLTNGTQSAFNMLMGGLVGRGEVLAVEDLTYPSVLVLSKRFGFVPHGVAMDGEGMLPDALESLCRRKRPKAMYAMSTLQNPTTVTMSLDRRAAIVAVARKYDLQIIEDDIYSLLPEAQLPPLSALAPERGWYMLGTAKSVASGLKVAYVVTPSETFSDTYFWPGVRSTFWMAAPINAAVSTQLIENGGTWRIIDAVRDEMRRRYTVVRPLVSHLDTSVADGALHLWVRLPTGLSAERMIGRVRSLGIAISGGAPYAPPDEIQPEAIRICLGYVRSHDVLAEAVRTVAASIQTEAKIPL
ncbi:PLP-dependent aminotransferase family protein [Bradyrhizobium xenonodulans]|uniref:PLP-dependent aminotransferase family protein n=1 Tax=Bradyrhizobium xenonodulans TaxID=2736875 RepID=A0ABY7MHD0_9BRAD|nr:PLP-dependent aminotransferase family protein [Bradyrhizobium xenonodulans]WBL77835.1 PLP-dependent aminotransferase family protein [Bradyrhizobium xenonodulans]